MTENELRALAHRLSEGQLAIFLEDEDELTVIRNTAGNLNPGYRQEMTVAEAVKFGAWGTSRGTMTAAVSHEGAPVYITLSKRAYKVINVNPDASPWLEAAKFPGRLVVHHASFS